MPITDSLVLPVDVSISPISALPAAVQLRLKAQEGEYAVSRPRGRAHAKIVSAEGAGLLQQFRQPLRVVDAVRAIAERGGRDPEDVLAEVFPLLRDCFGSRFLVSTDSPDAASILPTRERGDKVGRFEVLRCVHLLSDSELYQVRTGDGALLALKLVRPGAPSRTSALISREAAVLKHLGSHGTPELIARGKYRGRPWLALSWCSGIGPEVAFAEHRDRNTPEARKRVLELMHALLRGYASLHARGVLHGDVHPKNLLIGRNSEVTILDFGIARAIPPLRFGRGGGRGGVPRYYPPEYAKAQLAGRDLPAPTLLGEQFALGALLYELITGSPYAEFELDRGEMLRQITTSLPLPFATRQVAPWTEVEQILSRMLEKHPKKRFESLDLAAAEVEGLLRKEGIAASAMTSPRSANGSARRDLIDHFLSRVDFEGPDFPGTGATAKVAPTASLMHGSAGVAWSLLRLAAQRDDARLLSLADAWLAQTEADLESPVAFDAPGTLLTSESLGPISPFHAASGVHLTRALLSIAFGDRTGTEKAVVRFRQSCQATWDLEDLTLGRAGILLGCCAILDALPSAAQNTRAMLRELGDATLDWLWDRLDRAGPIGSGGEFENFGIAHGWAGLLYVSLRYCRRTGTELSAALPRRLDELARCAEPVGRGVRWWQRREAKGFDGPGSADIPGWCNGPAGFIHLWTLAWRELGEARFLALAEASAWSTWEAAPAGPTLCCGSAGQAYGLLNIYRTTGDTVWRERASLLADKALRVMTHPRHQSERPLGLFTGAPGLVLLLADLERPESAAMPFFEADPWPGARVDG